MITRGSSEINYGARKKGMHILLSNSQAGPGTTVKQEQEDIYRNHVQAFFPELCILCDTRTRRSHMNKEAPENRDIIDKWPEVKLGKFHQKYLLELVSIALVVQRVDVDIGQTLSQTYSDALSISDQNLDRPHCCTEEKKWSYESVQGVIDFVDPSDSDHIGSHIIIFQKS